MRIVCVIALMFCSFIVFSQDKIIKKTGEEISCEVTEVGVEEIKYYYADKTKLIFGIDKGLVSRIEFATGEVIDVYSSNFENPDFYADQNKHAVKVNFLSPLMGTTELVYEKNIKPGKSWESSLGIIGLGLDPQDQNAVGVYGKFAYKFIRTPDFYMNKMRYAHILKGAYFAPEIALRYLKYDAYVYDSDDSFYYGYKERADDFALAIMLKFGKQWVFSDSFLVDLFWGIGYGFSGSDEALNYGFIAGDSSVPIAITGGLRVGWTF